MAVEYKKLKAEYESVRIPREEVEAELEEINEELEKLSVIVQWWNGEGVCVGQKSVWEYWVQEQVITGPPV